MADGQPFGLGVRERRRALDLTQEELARRVGCASVTLRKIETGRLRPSRQIAERLAVALGLPFEERPAFVRAAREALVEPAEARDLSSASTPGLNPEDVGSADLSGRAVRSYLLGERVGVGGFGAVYRAVQPGIERDVAIKLILPRYADDPDFIRRFEAEARLIARLEHPHIVPLYDYWRDPGFAFLVMRFLRGGSLADRLGAGPLEPAAVLALIEQVGGALAAAHRAGIIHRDLKPSNILLDGDGNAFLADFGIAKNLGDGGGDLTGAVYVGSPAYSSPEQIRAEPVTPQTDIYAFGVLIFELLSGQRPFRGPTPAALIQQHLSHSLPRLSEVCPGLPSALDLVLQRATAKLPGARYPDVVTLLDELREALAAGPSPATLGPQQRSEVAAPTLILGLDDADNPYKGLQPFDEADAEQFFGRESLVQQLLSRLGEEGELARFLALIGPSGSGKSSLVRAGLIPALRRGGLPSSDSWFVVALTPGAHPLDELARQLRSVAPLAAEAEDLRALLGADDRGLLRAARMVLPRGEEPAELLLFIDQFEEVFTLCRDVGERAQLLRALVTAVLDERSRLRVILTLRGDFVDQALLDVDFGELIRRRSELLLPLTPEELERAIVGPAQRLGMALEDGLLATMIDEVGGEPGALPLLQHALSELFRRRSGRVLTRAAYAELGGVSGALAASAEAIYAGLGAGAPEAAPVGRTAALFIGGPASAVASDLAVPPPAEGAGDLRLHAAARQLFLRLVTPGMGVADTRRRATRSELAAVVGPGLDTLTTAFGRSRLLSLDHDPASREPTVEVAHEALLRAWPRLRDWLATSREALLAERRLAQAAAEWERSGREPSFLATGARLEQFVALAESGDVALSAEERAYLTASVALRDQQQAADQAHRARDLAQAQALADEQARRAQEAQSAAGRLRRRATYLAAALALALVAVVVAGTLGNQARVVAERNATLAEENVAIASTAQVAAEQNATLAAANAAAAAAAAAERDRAERAAALSSSRELALAAISNLPIDAERSVLLALQALEFADTPEAQSALHQAVQASRVRRTIVHQGEVRSVAYSPDGTRLATATDTRIHIRAASSGQELLVIEASEGAWPIRFSPDSRLIAASYGDNTARLWDVTTGREVLALAGHADFIWTLAFSSDGTRLATASADTTAKIWDLATGQELLTLAGHTEAVSGVGFSPDGARLVTGSVDTTAKLWDLASGAELLTLSGHTYAISAFFSPDGAYIATTAANDEAVKLWDAADGSELYTLSHPGGFVVSDFSPDGARLFTGSQDGSLKMWDPASGDELLSLGAHPTVINDVALHPDGIHLATAGRDGTVRVWDISPQGEREWLTLGAHAGRTNGVVYSSDGSRIATAGDDGLARVWDVETGAELLTLSGHSDNVHAIVFSPDGARLATSSRDQTVRIWDAESGAELLTLSWPGHGDGLVGSVFRGVLDVAFSPDGARLASAGSDGTVVIWDTASGAALLTITNRGAETQPIGLRGVAFSPDGTSLATATGDPFSNTNPVSVSRVWDVESGAELFSVTQPVRTAELVFSPDGSRIAGGGFGGNVQIWDGNNGDELLRLSGHTASVSGLAFSPDSRLVATASGDGTVRLWDVASGAELLSLAGGAGPVTGVSFSPDGSRLAVSGNDGTARVYLLEIDELKALAIGRLTRWLSEEECRRFLRLERCPPAP